MKKLHIHWVHLLHGWKSLSHKVLMRLGRYLPRYRPVTDSRFPLIVQGSNWYRSIGSLTTWPCVFLQLNSLAHVLSSKISLASWWHCQNSLSNSQFGHPFAINLLSTSNTTLSIQWKNREFNCVSKREMVNAWAEGKCETL